jgi:hypothetical protein
MMKPTFMQRKFLVRAALVLLLIAGSFMVLLSSSRTTTGGKKTCTESIEDRSKKIRKNNPSGEMIWETLSRQFISTVEISN